MDKTGDTNKRLEPRSNVFVIATLYAAGGSVPVRIRNMSANGALVETGQPPPIGSPVRLCRGSHSVTGEIMWVDDAKAGVHFTSATCVSNWLPGGKRGVGQQMADELVHQARLGVLPSKPMAAKPEPGPATLSDELLRLSAQLGQAGEDLAADPNIAARYADALQAIDGAVQALSRLATQGPDPGPAITSSALI